ncbi:MAG: helix-hairpin-helix domain-containing protein [Planctomycetaceae bacterium]|nr:helix-hairpin-helix domain-containing protein [Planctomycetaceae bacterium]
MQEDLKGLPVPLSLVDDSERREQLVAVVRLREDDQWTVLRLLLVLVICVVAWLGFFESGKTNVSKTVKNPNRELQYLVDLNNAPKNELLQLPGIGATLAERIVEYRNDVALFKIVADLKKIQGIGDKKCETATPYVYIGDRDEGTGIEE